MSEIVPHEQGYATERWFPVQCVGFDLFGGVVDPEEEYYETEVQ